MVKKFITAMILAFLMIGIAACNLPVPTGGGQSQDDFTNTAAAKTIEALTTSVSSGRTPTPEGWPTVTSTLAAEIQTLTPTSLAAPTLTITGTAGVPCNRASFVDDVTVRDGSILPANSRFVKKWSLKNTGSCTWTSGYTIIFSGRGNSMTSQASFPLVKEGEVKPNETVIVSAELTAPGEAGTHRGYWRLRSADQQEFGIGANGAGEFYVEIAVGDEYSFAEHACEAEWSTGAGKLECPGKESDNQGHVVLVQNPTLEDNEQRDGTGLITMAQPVPNGYIVGKYPPVVVPPDSDFRAMISCKQGVSGCYVRFKVTYRVENGDEQVLGEWSEGHEGGINNAVKDLDHLSGRQVTFYLYLYVAGTPDQSKGVWFNPRITR